MQNFDAKKGRNGGQQNTLEIICFLIKLFVIKLVKSWNRVASWPIWCSFRSAHQRYAYHAKLPRTDITLYQLQMFWHQRISMPETYYRRKYKTRPSQLSFVKPSLSQTIYNTKNVITSEPSHNESSHGRFGHQDVINNTQRAIPW